MPREVHRRYVLGEAAEIDVARRVVLAGDQSVPLRPRTFDLLVYLVEHRDRVVPVAELKEKLWPTVAVTDNSVMQCVNEARKALGDDSREQTFIRTVPKAGYQFVGPVVAGDVEVGSEPVDLPAPGARRGSASTAAVLYYLSRPQEPPWWEAAWLKFDEGSGGSVTDSISGLSAPIPPGVTWRPGVFGSALGFPGGEIAVQGRASGAFPAGLAPQTLLASVRATGRAGLDAVIFQYGDMNLDSPSAHFYIGLHDTGIALFGNRSDTRYGKSRIDDGTWRQVAGVFDGGVNGMMRLYVDGVEEARDPARGPLGPGRDVHWSVGRRLMGGTTIRGDVDDVRVFSRALRPAELKALARCQSGASDVEVGGERYWFSPVFGHSAEWTARGEGEISSRLRNPGLDVAGVSFARAEPGCPLGALRASQLPDDLRIEVDLRFGGPADKVTEAGPWFRSRKANPGDGIIGGTSAGYWVQLFSTGEVRVMRLHPLAAVAISDALEGFAPGEFHRLTAEARGAQLRVTLDGRPVMFDVTGKRTESVPLDKNWETASPPGRNGGAAGIAFSALRNRDSAGGQEARNIKVVVGQ